ncbi:protein DGCR6 isoform X2 [Triplophysa dalaica]|uniref:protein DGCR6 isoform X2 n=1 Tax=Triplophysa dalaica TaxID=1582913 RepID=UPI0024DFE58C|nr:protein DGCR6 isoform X2 [Triplophysa dalaica]
MRRTCSCFKTITLHVCSYLNLTHHIHSLSNVRKIIDSEWGMDTYSLIDDQSDAARQQERHYYLLSELQSLVKDLPSSFQQRLSYTTLSDLAQALIDGTVYEIVQGLLDIQHLTEKNLYNQRQKLHCEHRALKQELLRKHRQALQTCKSHNVAVLKSNQRTETEALEHRVREEQRMMDEKIVAEMDQKVLDQQNTLEKAGADDADESSGADSEAAAERDGFRNTALRTAGVNHDV